MSNVEYSQEAQQKIDEAENKLTSAINNIRNEDKDKPSEVVVVEDDDKPVEVNDDRIQVVDQDNNETPKATSDAPKEGANFVETDNPEIQARINHIYGQMKASDYKNQMLLEHNQKLEDRLSETLERLDNFERSVKDTESNRTEDKIKEQIRAARDDGDYDTISALEDQLLDLKLERRLSDRTGAPNKEMQPEDKEKDLSPQEKQLVYNEQYIQSLANEKDTKGNPLRPYLYDWHPRNTEAVRLFEDIPKEFATAGKQVDIETVMRVLDERMQGKESHKRSNRSQEVLNDDGGVNQSRGTLKLTKQQLRVAQKMGLDPVKYARQAEQLKQLNG